MIFYRMDMCGGRILEEEEEKGEELLKSLWKATYLMSLSVAVSVGELQYKYGAVSSTEAMKPVFY
jgi:hypothetical protein